MINWFRNLFAKKVVYAVIMYRFGDPGKHSYFLGVYSSDQKARDAGAIEHVYRGGKYTAEIVACPIDEMNEEKWKVYFMEDEDL